MAPAATVALMLLLARGVWAEPPTETLRDFFTRANQILIDPVTEGRPTECLNAIRKIVNDIFDFREAAELALGPAWHVRTPAEQDEFVRLFADSLERAFVSRVASRAQLNGGVTIRFRGESIDGTLATVRTTIVGKDRREIPLEYRMRQRGDRWAVRDVVFNGVSIVANYRAQLESIIRRSSYETLVMAMKAKTVNVPSVSTAAAVGVARATVQEPPRVEHAVTAAAEGVARATVQEPPRIEHTVTAAAEGVARVTVQEPPRIEHTATAAPGEKAVAFGTDDSHTVATAVAEPESRERAPGDTAERSSTERQPPQMPSETGPLKEQSKPVTEVRAVSKNPARAKTPSATTTVYWVQVGAFRHAETARQLATRLRNDNLPVSVGPGPRGDLLSRVRVGPFVNRAEATVTLRKLQAKGYSPFIAAERN